MTPALLVAGPAEHGVTRFGLELAATPPLDQLALLRVADGVGDDLRSMVRSGPGGEEPALVHVQVTDRLFGDDAGTAAARLVDLARHVPLSVTLHDLPQESDGPTGFAARSDAYAAIVGAARGVVVSSDHERALLDEVLARRVDDQPEVVVIPLPITQTDATGRRPAPHPAPRPAPTDRDLVLLGFVYPGKGHEEAIDALEALPPDVGVVNLGRASDGHEDLVAQLTTRAAGLGRRFEVTGYLPDDELVGRLRAAAVPVAAHRHLSASGSINSWLAAGRRPLVPRGRYTEELESRCPGSLLLYDDLALAARRALEDPESTWLDPAVQLGPSLAEVAAAYAEVLARWARP